MNEWKAIETAPTQNVRVLVRLFQKHRKAPERIVVAHSRDGQSWWTEPGMYSVEPTHWMPLPEPPK